MVFTKKSEEELVAAVRAGGDGLASSVRLLKNASIGSRRRKEALLQADAVEVLLACLGGSEDEEVLEQALVAVGSLANSTSPHWNTELRATAAAALVPFTAHNHEKIVEAACRSLDILMRNADTAIRLSSEAELVQRLLSLSAHNRSSVVESAVSVLARLVPRTNAAQHLEQGNGVEKLAALLRDGQGKLREAALEAIVALTRESGAAAAEVLAAMGSPQPLISLLMEPSARVRYLAARCLASMYGRRALEDGESLMRGAVLPAVVRLLDDLDTRARALAPAILADIVSHSEALQKAACDSDAIGKLARCLSLAPNPATSASSSAAALSEPSSDAGSSDDEAALYEGVFRAMAELSLSREQCRKQIIEAQVLDIIVRTLQHPRVGVRAASCECVRSLSRSVRSLRTALVDAGVAKPLYALLGDTEPYVQFLASATLCNLVLDFSPMKEELLESGSVARIVALLDTDSAKLRLNCIWALKNVLFLAKSDLKQRVMAALTYERLVRLARDSDDAVRVQAMTLLRNLVYGRAADVEACMSGIGSAALREILADALASGNEGVVTQALYTVCNIATGSADHRAFVIDDAIIHPVLQCIESETSDLRVAAIWCVINLTWNVEDDAALRVGQLRALGCEEKLRAAEADNNVDVRDRVRTALEQFSQHVPSMDE